MGIAARLRLPLAERTSLPFVGFCLLTLLVYIVAALLVLQLFGQQEMLNKRAFETGQHVRLLVQDGRVEGNIVVTAPPPTPVEPAQVQSPSPGAASVVPDPQAPVEPIVAPAEGEAMPPLVEPAPVAPAATHIITLPLNPAPNPDLLQPGEKDEETGATSAPLPKISDKGIEPWQYYGKSVPKDVADSRVGILVTGLGINKAYTRQALNLPEFISLSFSPYAPDLAGQVKEARQAGHEVWLNLPMEPEDYPASDPGHYGLLRDMKNTEILRTLHTLMGLAPGIVGFVAPQYETFTNDKQMAVVMEEIKKRGLLLVLRNRNFTSDNFASHMAYITREVDAARDGNAPLPAQMLTELEAVSLSNGLSLGVVDYAPAALSLLAEWSAGLKEKGISLVGASAIREPKP